METTKEVHVHVGTRCRSVCLKSVDLRSAARSISSDANNFFIRPQDASRERT